MNAILLAIKFFFKNRISFVPFSFPETSFSEPRYFCPFVPPFSEELLETE